MMPSDIFVLYNDMSIMISAWLVGKRRLPEQLSTLYKVDEYHVGYILRQIKVSLAK